MINLFTWLIAIFAALWLWFMPVQYEGDVDGVTSAPPPTVTFIGGDISDP